MSPTDPQDSALERLPGRDLIPLAPRRDEDDERFVRRAFWRKVRRTLGFVPFIDEAVAGYYCAVDTTTPSRVRAVLFGALAYFVLPADMIPDFVAGLGFTDDASVLLTALTVVGPHIKERHKACARRFLLRERANGEAAADAG